MRTAWTGSTSTTYSPSLSKRNASMNPPSSSCPPSPWMQPALMAYIFPDFISLMTLSPEMMAPLTSARPHPSSPQKAAIIAMHCPIGSRLRSLPRSALERCSRSCTPCQTMIVPAPLTWSMQRLHTNARFLVAMAGTWIIAVYDEGM